jgi:CheY-like chemotaxis protein
MKSFSGEPKATARGGSGGAKSLSSPPVTVLHIDDDPNDTALLQAAIRKAAIKIILQNVEDGEQAIGYLSGAGGFADREQYPVPSLILLDLKMRRQTGFEVLKWVREHPELGALPIVVLSGSELQEDIKQAYSSGANSYLVKPIGFDALVSLVKSISSTWLSGQNSFAG